MTTFCDMIGVDHMKKKITWALILQPTTYGDKLFKE
jgi:hypothetical protein